MRQWKKQCAVWSALAKPIPIVNYAIMPPNIKSTEKHWIKLRRVNLKSITVRLLLLSMLIAVSVAPLVLMLAINKVVITLSALKPIVIKHYPMLQQQALAATPLVLALLRRWMTAIVCNAVTVFKFALLALWLMPAIKPKVATER